MAITTRLVPTHMGLLILAAVLWILVAISVVFLLCAPDDPLDPDFSVPSTSHVPVPVFYPGAFGPEGN